MAAKKDKKAKKGKGDQQQSEWPMISVSAHPRASNSIRRLKAWAGLGGFVLVAVLSWQAGVAPFEVGLRALAAGVGLYVVTWMALVTFWRSIVVEEARQEGERRREALDDRLRAIREQQEKDNGGGTNGEERVA